ncbi:IS3 family transposase [bacterium]|nr:IS3 family transposase [bacterium]
MPIRSDHRDSTLLKRIKALKLEHPFWGYRRVRAWLVYREEVLVNEKRVRRIMKEHGFTVSQAIHKAKRTASRPKPRADKPLQYWGIDATKFMVCGLGWVYLVIVLDWYTKKVAGWNLSVRNRTQDWKEALDMAVNREFADGVRGRELKLISDNGSQPTSLSFMRDMSALEIEQVFTSYNNPKGNAYTERMMRTIKEEVLWLNEFYSFQEAKEKLDAWFVVDYNKLYVHSSLGYRSPEEFEALYSQQVLKEAM